MNNKSGFLHGLLYCILYAVYCIIFYSKTCFEWFIYVWNGIFIVISSIRTN